MWSLPDINKLNERAAVSREAIEKEAQPAGGESFECEHCGQPSTVHLKYYDIFSDDPKGVTHLCGRCHENYGDGEDMFECCTCGRRMVTNYTWELYYRNTPDGQQCLSCAAKEYFADDTNLIDPKLVKIVVLEPKGPALFDPLTGVLNLAKAPHVLGVEQPVPGGIKYEDNFEFDATDGHQISGSDPLLVIKSLPKPFFIALDAGWQFAVSVGLYTRE